MSIVAVLYTILIYLLIAAVIGGFLFFIIKKAVKEGVLDALEDWHGESDRNYSRLIHSYVHDIPLTLSFRKYGNSSKQHHRMISKF